MVFSRILSSLIEQDVQLINKNNSVNISLTISSCPDLPLLCPSAYFPVDLNGNLPSASSECHDVLAVHEAGTDLFVVARTFEVGDRAFRKGENVSCQKTSIRMATAAAALGIATFILVGIFFLQILLEAVLLVGLFDQSQRQPIDF